MRKLLFAINIAIVVVFICLNTANAQHYINFQEIDFIEGGDLLYNINLDNYYNNVKKRKFAGWRVHYINKHVKVKYKTQTLLDFYNDGTTPFEYEYKTSEKDVVKFGISVKDNVKTELSGNIEKFKGSLSKALGIEGDYEKTATKEESVSLKIDVDPQTQLIIYEEGEGYVTNGVCASYAFWVRTCKGGFEFFYPATQYQKIIKRKI